MMQLDVNTMIRLLQGVPEFVSFAQAQQATGLSYTQAARTEFLAGGHGTDKELETLAQTYGVVFRTDLTEAEIDAAAAQLQTAFQGDTLRRVLRFPDARIVAGAFLKSEQVATGDLQLFKRARDLGVNVVFVGTGRAAASAAAYLPRPVTIPGTP